MFGQVLVPLDGSRRAEGVLAPIASLVREAHGKLILLHAVTRSGSFSVPAREIVARERRRAEAHLGRLAARLVTDGIDATPRVVSGEPSRAIVKAADREKVDLIVMASHGRSGAREWAFGSVAERVLRITKVPVLVYRDVPAGAPGIRRILVPLDGSSRALRVMPVVSTAAAALRAEVAILHVGRKLPPEVRQAEEMLEVVGVPHRTVLRSGDPTDTIIGMVSLEHADVVAMTTTGEGRNDRIFFGSVVEGVLRRARVPMLLVRGA